MLELIACRPAKWPARKFKTRRQKAATTEVPVSAGKVNQRIAMIACSLLLMTLCTLAPRPLTAGDHLRELRIGDQFRSYSVHVPPSYDARKPTPVVLVFHSAMMNGSLMAKFCGLSEKADRLASSRFTPTAQAAPRSSCTGMPGVFGAGSPTMSVTWRGCSTTSPRS